MWWELFFLINYIFTKGISPFVTIRSDEETQPSFLNKQRATAAKDEAHAPAGFSTSIQDAIQLHVCRWGSSVPEYNQDKDHLLHQRPKTEGMGDTSYSKHLTSEAK